MEKFVEARLKKAQEFREEIDSLTRQRAIWAALIDLAKDPRWEIVETKLKEEVDSKLIQLLRMDDKGYLPRVDRKRATLRAEINVLRRFVKAPDIASKDFVESEDRIKWLEAQAKEIEDKYSHVRTRSF